MKINNRAPQALVNDKALGDVNNSAVKKTKTDAAKSAEIKDATKLNLSPQARQVSKAKEIARDQSVDEAKVARLQKAIDSGTYKVDAEKIADRMVDEHLMLPS